MSAPSFRLRLHLAVAALACVIIAAVSFAFFGASEVDRAALRSQSAQAVLSAHIMISSDALRLFKQMADSALLHEAPNTAKEDALIAALRSDFSVTRDLILNEAANFGRRENEADELDRLASLELEFSSILAAYRAVRDPADAASHDRQHQAFTRLTDRIDTRFNTLIQEAIAEEKREVMEADARLRAASRAIRTIAVCIASFSALLITLTLIYLNGSLLTSVRALNAGAEAYSRGDFDFRIPRLKADEFESIRQRFVHMAAEISANREAMRTSNTRLEKEVAERTAALADANKRLEAGDEARRGFFADISHELRTPLTVIRGEAEIALRGGEKDAATYRESLTRIVQYTGETTRLVDDLLFMARADAGEPRLELRSVALSALVDESVRSFEPVAAARPVRVVFDGREDGVVVSGDRGRLRQVIGVVLDNAIRYSRAGGEVRVALASEDGRAVIAVEDDGIGLSEADREHVFARFYRAENARAHSGGSGLGLPVAKAIIEAHKGHIRLAASASGGVRAEIVLPADVKLRAIS
jgi:signal transduction histidine kinase